MRQAGALRRELSARNHHIAVTTGLVHELTAGETPSVILRCPCQLHRAFYVCQLNGIGMIRRRVVFAEIGRRVETTSSL